ncbi:MAG: hypothetical protein AB1403_25940 [Candidatus Riflebacteria bacterium]
MFANRRGFLTFVIFFLVVFGIVGLYMGYKWYNQRYYITLYDGNMVRYLDVPPFTERISSGSDELRGVCVLSVGTSLDQVSHFFKSLSDRYGYLYSGDNQTLSIEVRKNYVINGSFADGKLRLEWKPVLNDKLQKKADSLFKKSSTNQKPETAKSEEKKTD